VALDSLSWASSSERDFLTPLWILPSKAINLARASWSASVASSAKAVASSSFPTISTKDFLTLAFHVESLFSCAIAPTWEGFPIPAIDPFSLFRLVTT